MAVFEDGVFEGGVFDDGVFGDESMLHPKSRLSNLERSLNVYLETQLVTGAGLVVVFPRETFGDVLPGAWVEVAYIPLSEEYPTTRGAVGWGTERQLLINANCFEQRAEQIGLPGGLAHQYSLTAMVDQVCDVLGPRAVLPIRDYAQPGSPTVAYFGWRQQRKQRIPGQAQLQLEHWNVSVTVAYSEEHV